MLLYYAFIVLHVLVCLILILVVLLQSGKGADLAGAFGGGATQTAFGSRGPASFLSKATTGAAIVFMITSIALSGLSPGSSATVGSGDHEAGPGARAAGARARSLRPSRPLRKRSRNSRRRSRPSRNRLLLPRLPSSPQLRQANQSRLLKKRSDLKPAIPEFHSGGRRLLAVPVPKWWNWQTRHLEGVVGKPVGVRVPPSAPRPAAVVFHGSKDRNPLNLRPFSSVRFRYNSIPESASRPKASYSLADQSVLKCATYRRSLPVA